jgi:uncharacterized membrane protein YebE (DUF533 family)
VADMSQEKVDLKKEQKKNRKKLNRKAKIQRVAITLCSVIVLVAACGWIGYSAYDSYQKKQAEVAANEEAVYTPVDLSAINDYISSLNNAE